MVCFGASYLLLGVWAHCKCFIPGCLPLTVTGGKNLGQDSEEQQKHVMIKSPGDVLSCDDLRSVGREVASSVVGVVAMGRLEYLGRSFYISLEAYCAADVPCDGGAALPGIIHYWRLIESFPHESVQA